MSALSRTRVPSYRHHKQSGHAIVTLTDGYGRRRDVLLGKSGTKESKADYKRVVLEWEANERSLPQNAATEITVAELIERYWHHVQTYYRRLDGSETKEVSCMMYSLRPLNHLHGKTMVKNFGPAALKAVRELMVRGYAHPKYGRQKPSCRNEVNKRVKRIRRIMKWGIENELTPVNVPVALQSVASLKRGRSEAHEAPGVTPIARAFVEETLPILRPTKQDMVMLQLETGMRPGELVTIRPCDIDMSGVTWLYRPPQHKTLHRGQDRIIAIGPRGQEIANRHLTMKIEAPLFSPAKLMEERAANAKGVQPDALAVRPKRKKRTVSTGAPLICIRRRAVGDDRRPM